MPRLQLFLRPLLGATLLLAQHALAPTAFAAEPKASKPPAVKPAAPRPASAKKAVAAPRPPVETGPAAASPEQLSAAEQVYFGAHECEFSQSAQITANPKYAGYVDVKQGKTTYLMKPVLSSTGAIRLEDVKGQTLMVQIASKSMLLDVKAGRRIVDECVSAKHREAVERSRLAKLEEAAAVAAAAASAAASGIAPAPVAPSNNLLSGPAPAVRPIEAMPPAPAAAAAAAPASALPAASAASAS